TGKINLLNVFLRLNVHLDIEALCSATPDYVLMAQPQYQICHPSGESAPSTGLNMKKQFLPRKFLSFPFQRSLNLNTVQQSFVCRGIKRTSTFYLFLQL